MKFFYGIVIIGFLLSKSSASELHPLSNLNEDTVAVEILSHILSFIPVEEIDEKRLVCQKWDACIQKNLYFYTFPTPVTEFHQIIPFPKQDRGWWFNRYTLANPRLKKEFIKSFATYSKEDQIDILCYDRPDLNLKETISPEEFWELFRIFISKKTSKERRNSVPHFFKRVEKPLQDFNTFLQKLNNGDDDFFSTYKDFLDEGVKKGYIEDLRNGQPIQYLCYYLKTNRWIVHLIQALEALAFNNDCTLPSLETKPGMHPRQYSFNLEHMYAVPNFSEEPSYDLIGLITLDNHLLPLQYTEVNFTEKPFALSFMSLRSLRKLFNREIFSLNTSFLITAQHRSYPLLYLHFFERVAQEIYRRTANYTVLQMYENLFVRVLEASPNRFRPFSDFREHYHHGTEDFSNDKDLVRLYFKTGPITQFDHLAVNS